MELKADIRLTGSCNSLTMTNPFNGIERTPPLFLSPLHMLLLSNPFNGIESSSDNPSQVCGEPANPFNGIERGWIVTLRPSPGQGIHRIHSMELKVYTWVFKPSAGHVGIHSMELKGTAYHISGLFPPFLNPFNGIESSPVLLGSCFCVVRIHSMELKGISAYPLAASRPKPGIHSMELKGAKRSVD